MGFDRVRAGNLGDVHPARRRRGTTGKLFGSTLSNPFVLAFVAIVFLALAASISGRSSCLPSSLNIDSDPAALATEAVPHRLVSGLIAHLARGQCSPESSAHRKDEKRAFRRGVRSSLSRSRLGFPFWPSAHSPVSLPKGGRGWST